MDKMLLAESRQQEDQRPAGRNREAEKRYPPLCKPEQKLRTEIQKYSYLCRLKLNQL